MEFSETRVARHYADEVVLIDITRGPRRLVEDLEQACEVLGIDLLIGVDVGGDVLAEGHEPGLRSPVIDSIGLIVLDKTRVDSCLGMFGYGTDGELTLDEIESNIARISSKDGLLGAWGLTRETRDELRDLVEVVDTEASRLPVEAASGALGMREIRQGELSLELKIPSTITFYFPPGIVADMSGPADFVRGSQSLTEATEAIREAGSMTEFDVGEQRLRSRHQPNFEE